MDEAERVLILALPDIAKVNLIGKRQSWKRKVGDGKQLQSLAATNNSPLLTLFKDGTPLADLSLPGSLQRPNRFTRFICSQNHGIGLLNQRDIFSIRQILRCIRPPTTDLHPWRPQNEDIIIAAKGQTGEGSLFGRVELGAVAQGMLITEDAVHFSPINIDSYYLFAVLNSSWGRAAMKCCGVGTSIPTFDARVASTVRIPRLNAPEEVQVAMLVKQAIESRTTALNAEKEAVRIIEEEVLPEWLA